MNTKRVRLISVIKQSHHGSWEFDVSWTLGVKKASIKAEKLVAYLLNELLIKSLTDVQ